jgi:hypothetical protein
VVRGARANANIGLIPSAVGGSALREWEPGAPHYTAAVQRTMTAAKRGTLRAILWHQGEADSNDENLARTYGSRWRVFMSKLREDLGTPHVPVVVGQLGLFLSAQRYPQAHVVSGQLAMQAESFPRTAFVPSGALVHKGDEVHFDSPSLREFGRRYAHAFLMLDEKW